VSKKTGKLEPEPENREIGKPETGKPVPVPVWKNQKPGTPVPVPGFYRVIGNRVKYIFFILYIYIF
jgi:hypothetical protein